jgi:transposase
VRRERRLLRSLMNTWIGIDIAKKSFVVCLLLAGAKPVTKEFENSVLGREKFLVWAGGRCELAKCHFCMESTGVYGFELACLLAERGLLLSVENPRRIKHFGVACNLKNKTDKADALVIAQYSKTMEPRPWRLTDPRKRELAQLRARAKQISQMRVAETSRLENSRLPDLVTRQIKAHIERFRLEEQEIVEEIGRLLIDCQEVRIVYEAITKIKGVGHGCGIYFATAIDVQSIDSPGEAGAALGLSPRKHQSGAYVGQTRITRQGDSGLRSIFCFAARAAARFNPVLKAFYDRLRANGLKKKQAWVAVARKLAIYCWAVAKRVLVGQTPFYPGGECKSRIPWKKSAGKSPEPLTC